MLSDKVRNAFSHKHGMQSRMDLFLGFRIVAFSLFWPPFVESVGKQGSRQSINGQLTVIANRHLLYYLFKLPFSDLFIFIPDSREEASHA